MADYEQTLLNVKGEWNLNCCFGEAISEGDFMLNRLKIPLYIQVSQVQKLKELSLPAVAEELSHNLNDSFTGKVNENMAKLKEKFNNSIIYYK